MSTVKDINGIEIKPGMRVVRLIKSRNNAKDVEGIVVKNKYKEHGLAIKVEFARFHDGSIMKDSGGYMHGLKLNNNYLVLEIANPVSIKSILATFSQQSCDDLEIKKENDLITIGYFHKAPIDCVKVKNGFVEYIVFDRQKKLNWLFSIYDKKMKVIDDYFNE